MFPPPPLAHACRPQEAYYRQACAAAGGLWGLACCCLRGPAWGFVTPAECRSCFAPPPTLVYRPHPPARLPHRRSYEGTYEVNALVAGRGITGIAAIKPAPQKAGQGPAAVQA